MGNQNTKTKKSNKKSRALDRNKLDILLRQIYYTTQLSKDRRRGQQLSREKELLAFFRKSTDMRCKDQEYQKAASIVNDTKQIKAQEYIMQYTRLIQDNQITIELSKGDINKVNDLIPYVESVIWGCQKGNLECIRPFQDFISGVFGAEAIVELNNFTKVKSELKNCYTSILPSDKEVKTYLIDLCNRNGIALEILSEIGHNVSFSDNSSNPHNGSNNFPSNPQNQACNQLVPPSIQSFDCPFIYQNNLQPLGYYDNSAQGNYLPKSYDNYPQNIPEDQCFQLQKQVPAVPYCHFAQPNLLNSNTENEALPQAENLYPTFSVYAPRNSSGNCQRKSNQYPSFAVAPLSNVNLNTDFERFSFGMRQPNDSSSTCYSNPELPKFGNDVAINTVGVDPLDELELKIKNIKKGL